MRILWEHETENDVRYGKVDVWDLSVSFIEGFYSDLLIAVTDSAR